MKLIAANRLSCITLLHPSLWYMVSLLDHQLGLIGSLQVKVSIFQYGWSMIITIICSFCCRTMWKLRKHQTSSNVTKHTQTSSTINLFPWKTGIFLLSTSMLQDHKTSWVMHYAWQAMSTRGLVDTSPSDSQATPVEQDFLSARVCVATRIILMYITRISYACWLNMYR